MQVVAGIWWWWRAYSQCCYIIIIIIYRHKITRYIYNTDILTYIRTSMYNTTHAARTHDWTNRLWHVSVRCMCCAHSMCSIRRYTFIFLGGVFDAVFVCVYTYMYIQQCFVYRIIDVCVRRTPAKGIDLCCTQTWATYTQTHTKHIYSIAQKRMFKYMRPRCSVRCSKTACIIENIADARNWCYTCREAHNNDQHIVHI